MEEWITNLYLLGIGLLITQIHFRLWISAHSMLTRLRLRVLGLRHGIGSPWLSLRCGFLSLRGKTARTNISWFYWVSSQITPPFTLFALLSFSVFGQQSSKNNLWELLTGYIGCKQGLIPWHLKYLLKNSRQLRQFQNSKMGLISKLAFYKEVSYNVKKSIWSSSCLKYKTYKLRHSMLNKIWCDIL